VKGLSLLPAEVAPTKIDPQGVPLSLHDPAEGCSATNRNSNSHEAGLPELPEHQTLELLAAFRTLARWVDIAKLQT
jgi:hypothetical protein